MSLTKKLLAGAVCAASIFAATSASATITVGGYTFDDNAFVDAVTGSSGTFKLVGGSTIASVILDKDPSTYLSSRDTGAYLDLAFTDNVAVNGPGTDIVLFELGYPDTWTVTINGITKTAASIATGQFITLYSVDYSLNAATLDLTDFGIPTGGTVDSLRLSFNLTPLTQATTSLVGALNSESVPEPATWAMMVGGFGLVGAGLRRQRRTTSLSFSRA